MSVDALLEQYQNAGAEIHAAVERRWAAAVFRDCAHLLPCAVSAAGSLLFLTRERDVAMVQNGKRRILGPPGESAAFSAPRFLADGSVVAVACRGQAIVSYRWSQAQGKPVEMPKEIEWREVLGGRRIVLPPDGLVGADGDVVLLEEGRRAQVLGPNSNGTIVVVMTIDRVRQGKGNARSQVCDRVVLVLLEPIDEGRALQATLVAGPCAALYDQCLADHASVVGWSQFHDGTRATHFRLPSGEVFEFPEARTDLAGHELRGVTSDGALLLAPGYSMPATMLPCFGKPDAVANSFVHSVAPRAYVLGKAVMARDVGILVSVREPTWAHDVYVPAMLLRPEAAA